MNIQSSVFVRQRNKAMQVSCLQTDHPLCRPCFLNLYHPLFQEQTIVLPKSFIEHPSSSIRRLGLSPFDPIISLRVKFTAVCLTAFILVFYYLPTSLDD